MSPPDAEITELPSSPGARLRREREAHGLTEQQAAESLTLDPTVIFALEANDFAMLGAPVFAKGHLRRYATLLGVPEDEVLGAYERSKQHMAEPTLVPKSRLEMLPERSRPKWPWVLGGALAFLVAALLVAYVSENGLPGIGGADDVASGDGGVPGKDNAGAMIVPQNTAPGASSTPDGIAAPTSGAAAGGTTGAPSSLPVPAGEGGSGAAAQSAAPATGAADVNPTPVTRGPGQVQLQLRFRSDSWVEVFDGSGRAVLYDLGKGGTERTLIAAAPLSVTLGNAASVSLAVNGRNVAAPRQAGQAMARFSVGPDGTVR
jgi:cytoskeleton protein RodZ